MKTYIAQPLKQRRTLDTGERGKQQPSLHKLLQTHPVSGDSLPAQLAMKEYEISGITHIVRVDEKGSLINGKTICTVNQGDTVRINDSIRLRSRRGPNTEVYELLYKRGNPIYKWYAVEKLNDSHLPPGCFIREDTLVAEDIEIEKAEGKRTRISPGQAPEHEDAARIIQNAKRLALNTLDESGLCEREAVSLFTVKLAYALGTDAGMRQALTGGCPMRVMNVVRILEQVCGKQLLQDWGSDKENDLEMRQGAWLTLQEVVTAFTEVNQQRKVLRMGLDHDKGYAQIWTYLQEALYPQDTELTFPEIVGEALKDGRNMSIFGEGMVLGTILEQIKHEGSLYQEATRLTPEREKWMWISITTAIVLVKSRGNVDTDWSYFKVMLTNAHTLFEIVQSKTNRLVFDEKLLTDFLADPF